MLFISTSDYALAQLYSGNTLIFCKIYDPTFLFIFLGHTSAGLLKHELWDSLWKMLTPVYVLCQSKEFLGNWYWFYFFCYYTVQKEKKFFNTIEDTKHCQIYLAFLCEILCCVPMSFWTINWGEMLIHRIWMFTNFAFFFSSCCCSYSLSFHFWMFFH